ncbi:MAG: pirin family protein [Propionibacteriaceae bacterium]
MSDLDTKPPEFDTSPALPTGPEELVLEARKVWLGKTTQVSRALPNADVRMIGAWCFADHYGPEDISDSPGMRVWAHPHTGLQTVSWLLEGEIEHRDGVGSRVMVRPGELNLMTAGHGIVHSELSLPDKPPTMHGVQLWVALPEAVRDVAPHFETYRSLPELARPGLRGQVLVGTVDGVTAPTRSYSALCAADLQLVAGAEVELAVDASFEHGVLVVGGDVRVESTELEVDQLLYLGSDRGSLRLTSRGGGRVILLGGEPFAEEIVMWWNFIGRTHAEVVSFREAWLRRDARFAPVVSRDEKVMEAPPMPTIALKARPRRRRR